MNRYLLQLAVVLIPLTNSQDWQNLQFSKLKANTVNFTSDGMSVEVNSSSSPSIYPLRSPSKVKAFRAELEITGALNAGKGFPDDAYFRLGLVAPGEKRLGRIERMLAAAWIKKLFSLAPENSGIDKIYFYNVIRDGSATVGDERILPGSRELIVERVIAAKPEAVNKMTIQYTLPEPKAAAALWISVDGDDTKSTFKTMIRTLELTTVD